MITKDLSVLTHDEAVLIEGGIMITVCVVMFALGMATAMLLA